MKRMIISAVLLTFMIGTVAFATDTRVRTMGEANNIVMDEANISLYPSTINYYPKLFIGEFEEDDYWRVGAHFLFAEESTPFVLGLYFNHDNLNQGDGTYYHDVLDYVGNKTQPRADHRIDLYYGRVLGEMPFGFAFSYFGSGSKNEDTLTTSNYDESLSRFEFMLGIAAMEKKLELGGGIALTTWTDEDYIGGAYNPLSEPAGNMELMLNARYWMDPMGKYVVVPHVGFEYEKQGVDIYGDDAGEWVVVQTVENKELMFDLGVGMNYEADEDVLLIGDIGTKIHNFEETFDNTDTDGIERTVTDNFLMLPYFKIGIDAKVFKWLDIRGGVYTRWRSHTYEIDNVGEKYTSSDADTETYFGAGFHWGRLTLDAEINTDFIENGPYFISGEEDYLTERVSLKYAF